ncbi:MAG: S8 family peptidase [Clostridiales bacterium]|nr:S8 family peptidase [Clostridiales bacterium]
MDCNEFILNENTIELVHALDEGIPFGESPVCSQDVGWGYRIDYYNADEVPPLSLKDYSYSSIPKCYMQLSADIMECDGRHRRKADMCGNALSPGGKHEIEACQVQSPVNLTALERSGITSLQNIRTLDLRGRGVLMAIIDSGVRFWDEAFRNTDGSTRVAAMWDQTVTGVSPENILYGKEYSREEINRALADSNEGALAGAEQDEDGHGTSLASIAAGSQDYMTGFTGAAPEAELIVVKLRQVKPYLRDFFHVPGMSTVYSEADILAALWYANQKALSLGMPLVVFLGIGSWSGGRVGTGVLDDCINQLAALRGRAVVCATGNSANVGRHFLGQTNSLLTPVRMEINVEKDAGGLVAELWAVAPERFSVDVASPTGQLLSKVVSYGDMDQEADFIFEGTHLNISYRDVYRFGQNLLIFFRFTNIAGGIWTIRAYPDVSIYGEINAWLPPEELSEASAVFLTPNPETTLATPSDAYVPISVGGYDASSGALYLDSGRGYNANGGIRPDFVAPAVRLAARGLKDNYVTFTGTSGAAALTAGACAQLLEWAVTRDNMPNVNSVDLKNLLIRGCSRQENYIYPSPESGYGMLDVYRSLENLRLNGG